MLSMGADQLKKSSLMIVTDRELYLTLDHRKSGLAFRFEGKYPWAGQWPSRKPIPRKPFPAALNLQFPVH